MQVAFPFWGTDGHVAEEALQRYPMLNHGLPQEDISLLSLPELRSSKIEV